MASPPDVSVSASLVVVDPNGHRSRVALTPLPFRIGRQSDNHLVVRDSRTSRNHAQIYVVDGEHVIEDAGSRHGLFVNSKRVVKHVLRNSDRIEFGVPDSYELIFAQDGAELKRLMENIPSRAGADVKPGLAGVGGSLGKLRAVLEIARTLQSSFSLQDILNSVVDATLAVTEAERGFLFLRHDAELEMRCARDRNGGELHESDLQVPRRLLERALQQRRDMLSMTFDPVDGDDDGPANSIVGLELRSVVCIPLVRLRAVNANETSVLSTANDTLGVLYIDSRRIASDLAAGNRELLQTLALEASTILENARLLEEERSKQRLEEELNLARNIQQSLLPKSLPQSGWFRAAGSSIPSYQVGGDYFDVLPVGRSTWAAVVADVSGKGVSSALLAALLQGAFLTVSEGSGAMGDTMDRINRFLTERTEDGKYATIFYAMLDRAGHLRYVNAGHCAPLLVPLDGPLSYLETTAMPVGLIDETVFEVEEKRLSAGDKIVIFSDGVTEAERPPDAFFGRRRLREVILANLAGSCAEMHDAIQSAVRGFTENAPQSDDVTLVVLEYRGEA